MAMQTKGIPGAPEGNQNAKKDPREVKDSFLFVRVRRADKARYVKAAQRERGSAHNPKGKLPVWVERVLDAAADRAGIPPAR